MSEGKLSGPVATPAVDEVRHPWFKVVEALPTMPACLRYFHAAAHFNSLAAV
jgi:hypothetical protein